MTSLVVRLSVSVPFSDEWDLIPLLQKQATGTLGLADLWAQHNEHRSFFPELIMLRMARFTHWNMRAEVVLNLILATMILMALAFLLHRTLGRRGAALGWGAYAVAAIFFSWMIFSPQQWENWLWGWQIAWFLSNLAAISAAVILSEWPDRLPAWLGVTCAAAAAVVASFSLASGLCAWVALVVVFALRTQLRRGLPIWIIVGATTVTLYLHNYRPGGGGGVPFALKHPVTFVGYLLAYLGAPVAQQVGTAVVAGLAICAVFAASSAYLELHHPEPLRRCAAWIGLGLYAMFGAVLTDLGRVNLGVSQSLSSRYVTLSMLVALSTLALALAAAASYAKTTQPAAALTRAARVVVVLAAAAVVFVNYNKSLQALGSRRDAFAVGVACLRTASSPADPCLMNLGYSPALVWDRLGFLRAHGLGGLPKN